MQELKGLKLQDIEKTGKSITLTFEKGYVVEFEPNNFGDSVSGYVMKSVLKEVGTI
ncbi:hypothetical protein MOD91_18305 [Bacillus haynesii]|uniref:hypothetical protein n=1 Tax=Bacillus haynesii TaxID=1925021 RepID=UPI00227F823A|nr:hypothetical protein [Bacillus haynesii]MCY8048476.1 hypothetical protein [Bacillus haynesii]MCY8668814.1 hypothetical protein [Bacillus haynesii]